MSIESQEPAIEATTLVDAGGINVAAVSAGGALKVDGSAATQPISGTVTANAGTNLNTSALALDATLTNATQKTKIVDTAGTNVAVVDATGDVQVDVNNFPATQAVTQSGTWTVQPGNTANTTPWLVESRAPTIPSYSAAILDLVAAATPTDVFTIYGSNTKTIKILNIILSATQNTAAVRDVQIIKRSATNTGGTSSSVTGVPHDSNNAAATATVLAYTANPSALGASVGVIRTEKVDISAANLVGSTDRLILNFGDGAAQAIVLRGTSQGLAINLNGVTSANNSFDIAIEWTEE